MSRWSDVTDVALSESSADHRKRRLATTLRQLALCAVTAFGAVALVGALAGCSEGESGDPNACSTDNDCQGRGVICADNTCSEQACTDRSECGQNRTCFQGLCTPAECTTDSQCTDAVCVNLVCQDPNNQSCMSDADCEPFGKTCNPITGMCVESGGCQSDTDCDVNESCNTVTGECVPGCTEDVDCPDGQYCDAGSCEMGCRVGECPANEVCNTETRECGEQCTVSECAAMDMTCDPDTGQCVERTGGAVCESCTLGNHAECGAPNDVDRCISLSQDQAVCSVGCESDADCPSGFQCQSVTTTRMGCVPASGACEGCLVDGCPENEVCAPGTASCIPKTETCSPCSTDLECGKGNTCTTFQNRERCLPRCGSDGSCPTDFTCNEDLCEPDSGMCTSCDTDPSTCTDGQVLDEDKCMCVDCVSDSDCEAGQACARGTSQCFNGGTGECTADSDCTDGVCAGQMDTDPGVCVECEVAEDCPNMGDICQDNTCQSCSCPAGEVCNENGVCVNPNECASDQECFDKYAQSSDESWFCDPQSQRCYSPGLCDPADPGIAPCASGMCQVFVPGEPGICQCDPAAQNCRANEICFGFPGQPGNCVGG